MSSDEYIFELLKGELEDSCPGELGCHGCQTWCPVCGDVPNICDSPTCDTHLRPPDIEKRLASVDAEMAQKAKEARSLETRLSTLPSPSPSPSLGKRATDARKTARQDLERVCGWYRGLEKDAAELEERLHRAREAGNKLWPRDWERAEERPSPAAPDPRQLTLPIG